MSVLGEARIKQLCPRMGLQLVEPFDEASVQPASYDLHLGEQYYVDDDGGGYATLRDRDTLKIPANGIAYFITKETLHMPLDVAGLLSLTMGLIKQGVMLSSQPPVDPGYSGRIIALLHNLSKEPVYIPYGDHVLTISFLDVNPQSPHGYKGKHQRLDSLAAELPSPPSGALRALRSDFESLREGVNRRTQTILVCITITMAILAAIVTILTGVWGYRVVTDGGGTNRSTSEAEKPYTDVTPTQYPGSTSTTDMPTGTTK